MAKKAEKKKVLLFADGTEVEVIGERGRFWLVEGAQWRKSNPAIVEVKTVAAKEKTAVEPSDEDAEGKEE